MVRAKFKLARIQHDHWHPDMAPYTKLRFEAQYDNNIPEDQRFQKATPNGHMEMQVDNEAALAQFQLGKFYYLDFTPA